ncbi:biotin/lipoyl-binding protein [bacterium]|nr:biotin/lipoyl-binding protein [bacterium]
MRYEIIGGGKSVEVDFLAEDGKLEISTDKRRASFDIVSVQPGVYSVLMDNRSFVVGVGTRNGQKLNVNGTPVSLELLDAVHLHLRDLGWESMEESRAGLVNTQIPGLITRIFHVRGDEVSEGEPLFLIEAMKMENEIRAPISGTIIKISVQEGQTVDKGTTIVEIE